MIGAIIGDIVGSIYEHNNIKTKDFPLFDIRCTYTDDTILSVATAKWLLEKGEPCQHYFEFAQKYPFAGYGSGFIKWLFQFKYRNHSIPYNSCGNGSAMRVGPVGWAFGSEEETLSYAKKSAECTHNHLEGIKGAQATALCIYYARLGYTVSDIKHKIEHLFGYTLSMPIEEMRTRYSWYGIDEQGNGALCQDSVPQAIICALQSDSFEDSIRNAISIGGDSDTIACISGSIAEALYGIPKDIIDLAIPFIPNEIFEIITSFETKFGNNII